MNKIIRYSAAALLALLAAASLISCKPSDPGPAGNESETAGETQKSDRFTIDETFKLVRSDYSEEANAAARYIREGVKEMFGFELPYVTDFVKRGEELVPDPHEILVGETNRPAAAPLYEGLRVRDYRYQIMNEDCIVITGGSEQSILEAAKAFMKDVFGYTGKGTGANAELKAGEPVSFLYDYPVKNLKVNGTDFTDWTIVYDSGSWKERASSLSASLSELSGYELPVVSGSKGKSAHGIFLKTLDHEVYSDFDIIVEEIDGDVYLEASNKDGMERAIELFLEKYYPKKVTETMDLRITGKERTYTFIGQSGDYTGQAANAILPFENGLVLKKKSQTRIREGVYYEKREYRDRNDKPVICYVMIAEPGTVDPVCGLPHAYDNITSGKLQNVMTQAKEAEAAYGYDICGAVNGDFAFSATEPCGTNYQNGVCLSHNAEFAFFAVKKDGSFFVGYDRDLDSFDNVKEAIGGRYLMLKDGKLTDLGYGIDLAAVRHPRTAIGFDDSGRLFLMEIDGRQPSLSNGASLCDMAMIFIDLGATNAINIDGGGSSTFITKDYNTGNFVLHNSPSDGNMRAVCNSLLLVVKEKE